MCDGPCFSLHILLQLLLGVMGYLGYNKCSIGPCLTFQNGTHLYNTMQKGKWDICFIFFHVLHQCSSVHVTYVPSSCMYHQNIVPLNLAAQKFVPFCKCYVCLEASYINDFTATSMGKCCQTDKHRIYWKHNIKLYLCWH